MVKADDCGQYQQLWLWAVIEDTLVWLAEIARWRLRSNQQRNLQRPKQLSIVSLSRQQHDHSSPSNALLGF